MIHVWRPPVNEAVWNHCLPWLERATDFGMWTTDHYLSSILSGHMALWLVEDGVTVDDPETETKGCFVTEFRETSKGRVLWLEAVGGNPGTFKKAWNAVRDNLDRFAAENGCVFIELQGRPGLLKMCKGFDHTYVTMRRPVNVQRQ